MISKTKRYRECGTVLIELAIVMPVLLLVMIVSLEISRTMRIDEYAANISRELASVAYRDCSEDRGVKLGACLQMVHDATLALAENLLAGSNLAVSIYRCEGGVIVESQKVITSGLHDSKYYLSGSVVQGLTPGFVCSQSVVVIAEAYVPFTSTIPIANLYGIETGMKYEVAIL